MLKKIPPRALAERARRLLVYPGSLRMNDRSWIMIRNVHRNSSSSSSDVWMWRVSVNWSTERYRLLSSSLPCVKHSSSFPEFNLNWKVYSKVCILSDSVLVICYKKADHIIWISKQSRRCGCFILNNPLKFLALFRFPSNSEASRQLIPHGLFIGQRRWSDDPEGGDQ